MPDTCDDIGGSFLVLMYSAKESTEISRVAITKNIIKSELRGLGTKGPTYPTRARKRNLGNLEYE